MKKTNFEKVQEFHQLFDPDSNIVSPTLRSKAIQKLRVSLIREEFKEFRDALKENDFIEVADAIGDLLYVVYGAANAFGLNADAIFAEIHRSNMTKLGKDGKPVLNGVNTPLKSDKPYGKVLKGPNYVPPNLKAIVFPDKSS